MWSGGNNPNEYLEHIRRETGFNEKTFLSREFLASENGVRLVKAMAKHEAGRAYPVSDDVIRTAQVMVMANKPGGMPAPTPGQKNPKPKTATRRDQNPAPPAPTGGKTPKSGSIKGTDEKFTRLK